MAELLEFPEEEFPFLGSEDSEGRAEGWHVTEIILDWLWTMDMSDYGPNEVITNDTRRRWERGFRWEDALMLGYRDQWVARPEPLLVDGIWMSPDGFDGEMVHEFKSTMKSQKSWLNSLSNGKWIYWSMQAQAYCYGLGVNKVRWWCMFEMGDYTRGPMTRREFDATKGAEWEDWELKQFWQMILNHKAAMEGRND